MSFRKNSKKESANRRKWDAFCQANWELIERIGMPLAAVETLGCFHYLLMHGSMYPYDEPSGFSVLGLREAAPEKSELFKALVDKYFEAGFHNPGIHPAYVGGDKQYLLLVGKYPGQFSAYDVKSAAKQNARKDYAKT